ncbi:cupin, partial [Salmonella enterica subsp. enterica serovar Enteritidis]|nr:cupin [Salmonella enterica subsp. enterica serovar Enteritidis]
MSRAMIEVSDCNVDLELRPIEPSWIIEGNPVSRSRILST